MITLNLLAPMGEVISVTGDPMRGSGWYGHTSGLHTVAIRVLNFQGRVRVQASIATEPSERDWFTVLPNDGQYIEYPQPGYFVQSPSMGETSTYGFNFTANVVWVRAIVDRAYLIPATYTPQQIMPFGVVDYVTLSYGR